MPAYKIFMGNLGYLRGINGQLSDHFRYFSRYLYCPIDAQKKAVRQLTSLLESESPDVCCFLEIDKGSSDSANFNQIEALLSDQYPFYDCENKYGLSSRLRSLPHSRGKSNAFIAKQELPYEKIYFENGTKRLVYKIVLPSKHTLFFTHFSLRESVRKKQFAEVKQLLKVTGGECIVLGDFNIWNGFGELSELMGDGTLHLLSMENVPTFTFHRFRKALDLCICTKGVAPLLKLRILHQPYSDHSALLLEIEEAGHA